MHIFFLEIQLCQFIILNLLIKDYCYLLPPILMATAESLEKPLDEKAIFDNAL